MDTFEIKDDEINVEDIMRQIRENIRKKKESGAYTKEMEDKINQPLQPPLFSVESDDLSQNLNYLNSNWDLQAEYNISSHRGIMGKPLVWGRSLVHGEVRRYVDLLAGKQSEFNSRVVRTLNSCFRIFEDKLKEAVASVNKDIDTKVNEAVAEVNKDIDIKLNEAVATVDRNIDTKLNEKLNQDIDIKVNEAVAAVNKDIENKAWLANLLEKRIERNFSKPLPEAQTDTIMNYFLFEEKYRGSTEEIKKRQSIYLGYFKNCQNVLDIGCGRGEFLELLKENNIGAKGIDLNEDMVLYCRKNGLDVTQIDAISYLESINAKSHDGIFMSQVAEHMLSSELTKLIKLSYDKMNFGSYFVAETINPLSVAVLTSTLYQDPSHIKPVHPETFKFLLESVGFREIEIKFLSPLPEIAKLKKLDSEEVAENEKKRINVMNENIEKLNAFLYGNIDYAIIALK